MFAAIARFASKFKYPILIVWVALTIIFFLTSPPLSKVGITDQTQFLPKGTESSQVRDLLHTKFPGYADQTGSSALIVVYNENDLTQQNLDDAKALRTWMLSANGPPDITNVISVYDNAALSSTLISADNTTMMMTVDFSVKAMDESTKQAVAEIRQQFKVHSGTNFYLTGNVGFLQDLFDSVQRTIDRTTLITIILVIILLLFIYRSPIAAVVPLAAIGMSFLISRGIIGFMAQAGVPVSTVTDALDGSDHLWGRHGLLSVYYLPFPGRNDTNARDQQNRKDHGAHRAHYFSQRHYGCYRFPLFKYFQAGHDAYQRLGAGPGYCRYVNIRVNPGTGSDVYLREISFLARDEAPGTFHEKEAAGMGKDRRVDIQTSALGGYSNYRGAVPPLYCAAQVHTFRQHTYSIAKRSGRD